ncbi:hypothetical protein BDW22DRAFT_1428945 [Trametopsis cervina]|nr:hypothetical protein BDW22DRAFT_1428945 [Trametopsis cervina]
MAWFPPSVFPARATFSFSFAHDTLQSIWIGILLLFVFFLVLLILVPGSRSNSHRDSSFDSNEFISLYLRNYVASSDHRQYCAIAILISVVAYMNIEAQDLPIRLLPQALAVISATSALACMFLLHFISQIISTALSSEREALLFFQAST